MMTERGSLMLYSRVFKYPSCVCERSNLTAAKRTVAAVAAACVVDREISYVSERECSYNNIIININNLQHQTRIELIPENCVTAWHVLFISTV